MFLEIIIINYFFLIYRYLNNLSELIEAVHILCSKRITQNELQTAEQLLISFTNNYEILYGESNVVFNIHLARHLVDCVKLFGPLFTYSNYCFEDNIGHLIALQNGNTDVATQICGKYLIEKNLSHVLPNSLIASNFHKEINSTYNYSNSRNVEGFLVIGKSKSDCENLHLIARLLNLNNDIEISEYNSVLIDNNIFYEIENQKNKRTYDSFVFNVNTEKFAVIKSIVVIENKLYFLISERFEKVQDQNQLRSIIYLKEIEFSQLKLIESHCIGPKFAFVRFDDVISCAEFPNMIERS